MAKEKYNLKKADREMLRHKIEDEGFDYCFTEYSNWEEITDPEFRVKIAAYQKSKKDFVDYLQSQGIEFD